MAYYPRPAPIDAYGNGGFRFAEMSHQGSILCLPSGIHGWDVTDAGLLVPEDFLEVFRLDQGLSFLLLGCGPVPVLPSEALHEAFAAAGIGLEPMDTGAACRTYNVLLAEGRPVGAALIAVD